MKLNKKQKRYLFTKMISKKDLVKLFETTNLDYLMSLNVEIGKKDSNGWRPLIVDKVKITNLNFDYYKEWEQVLDNINDYEQCQWCECWLHKSEMVFRKKGFTKLCNHCDCYLR